MLERTHPPVPLACPSKRCIKLQIAFVEQTYLLKQQLWFSQGFSFALALEIAAHELNEPYMEFYFIFASSAIIINKWLKSSRGISVNVYEELLTSLGHIFIFFKVKDVYTVGLPPKVYRCFQVAIRFLTSPSMTDIFLSKGATSPGFWEEGGHI